MSDPEQSAPLLPRETTSSYGAALQEAEILRSVDYDVLPETATYGRNLSWSSAYIIVISRVIGSGIFAMPGAIVKEVGSIGTSLILWIFGACIAWCGLAVSLEYGCMLPRSGGDKVYLEYTYQHPRFLASTLVAVQAVLLGFTASNCIIFAKYTLFALGIDSTDTLQKALAVGLLTAITIVHGCFLRTGIWVQNFLGWTKVTLIIFMFLTGLFVVLFRGQTPYEALLPITSSSDIWDGSEWSWGILSTAIFKVSYTYAGLGNINNVLNEVKDPVRTLKSVAPATLLTACVLYLLMNVAYFAVVPLQDIKESGELIAALFCERVFGAKLGHTVLPLAIAISAAGNVMVVTFALVSRLKTC
jgi:amino acid transporter